MFMIKTFNMFLEYKLMHWYVRMQQVDFFFHYIILLSK